MAEILKIREITIDTMQHKEFNIKEEELKLIRFYQNDLNSAKLLINVTHDKVVTDFSAAINVQIAFLKPDCKRVFQDVQKVNQMQGKYYVVLSKQTLIAYGNVIAQLRFTFPNNKVIETCKFAFTVDESIMCDEAMKSTNEFPVIQKAIEAGKKFEGVDIEGIIAAGELAKEALPKTGGTMTGPIKMAVPAAGSVGYGFQDTAGNETSRVVSVANGNVVWQDRKNLIDVFTYDSASKTFIMQAASNLVKTNEIYKGWLSPTGQTTQLRSGDDLNNLQASGKYGGTGMLNVPGNESAFWYIEVTQYGDPNYCMQRATNLTGSTSVTYIRRKTGNTWNPWEKLFDQKGGTITGNIVFQGDGEKAISFRDVTNNKEYVKMFGNSIGNRFGIYSTAKNKTILNYDGNADSFTLDAATTTNLMKKSDYTAKDGRANLVLTADATNPDPNNLLHSTRRGNTVSTSGAVILNVNATGAIVTTLPVDMRPVENVSTYVPSIDGSVTCQVFINASNGVMAFSTNAKGKRLEFIVTYVVN